MAELPFRDEVTLVPQDYEPGWIPGALGTQVANRVCRCERQRRGLLLAPACNAKNGLLSFLARAAVPAYHVFALPLPERILISQIRARGSSHPSRGSKGGGTGAQIVAGIGDDCAVLRIPARHDTLVTTDFSLEGVHFRREWHPPEVVGRRCLTRGLSDIAAMGGEPIAAFLSLALPTSLPQQWVDGFLKGLLNLADEFKVTLAGGDISQSRQGILADIIVVGSVPRGKAILRSEARPGDGIYVTGELGGSSAALSLLYLRPRKKLKARDFPAHFFPNPRIETGRILREKAIASSMIDISDGLSTDLTHICEESGVGAEVWQEAVPRASIGRPAREVSLETALHGGEDYELLFTSCRRVPGKIAGVTITPIGRITRKKKVMLADSHGSLKEFLPKGWEHFRS